MLTALLASLLVPTADACSFAGPEDHVIDPAEVGVDLVPPGPAGSPIAGIARRGRGPDCDADGICMSTSCDDIGIVDIGFTPATDDRSPVASIGYRLVLVEGELADGMGLAEQAVLAPEGTLSLIWIDDASDVQEPLDFTLGIIPIDLAGNEGEMSTVEVSDPGNDGDEAEAESTGSAGCVVISMQSVLAGSAIAFLLVAGRRRTPSSRA